MDARSDELMTELTDAKVHIDDLYTATYQVGYKYNEIHDLSITLRSLDTQTPLTDAEENLVTDIQLRGLDVLKAIKNLEKSIKELSNSMLAMADHVHPEHNIFW